MHAVRSGSGPPLLLVHGIGMSHRAFAPVVEDLATDHEVIAVDLPGFGASDLLSVPPTLRALADACAALVDGPFAVAGNSLGGAIALHLALDGRARAACALSPAGFAEGWERLWLHAVVRSSPVFLPPVAPLAGVAAARASALWTVAARGGSVTPAQMREVVEDIGRPGLRPTARHALNWRAPATSSFPVPVTIAWGDKDRLLLHRLQSARARERMPSARHVTLPGAGHVPMWDDPVATARVIRQAAN